MGTSVSSSVSYGLPGSSNSGISAFAAAEVNTANSATVVASIAKKPKIFVILFFIF